MGLFGELFGLGGGSAAGMASSLTGVQPAEQSFGSRLGNYLDKVKIGVGYGPVAATIGGNRSSDMDSLIKGMIQKYNTQGGIGGGSAGSGGGSCPGGVCKVEGITTNATPMSGTGAPDAGPVYTMPRSTDFRSVKPSLMGEMGFRGFGWGS